MKTTRVEFSTDDRVLQKIFDRAEEVCRKNIRDFDGRTVREVPSEESGGILDQHAPSFCRIQRSGL